MLMLYSSGKTSGIVSNIGHEWASVVPIAEGQPLLYAHSTTEVAGKQLI